jgi:hypothetical protein
LFYLLFNRIITHLHILYKRFRLKYEIYLLGWMRSWIWCSAAAATNNGTQMAHISIKIHTNNVRQWKIFKSEHRQPQQQQQQICNHGKRRSQPKHHPPSPQTRDCQTYSASQQEQQFNNKDVCPELIQKQISKCHERYKREEDYESN